MQAMKSYEARLLLLQMTQRHYGVPTSDEPGQEAPDVDQIEPYVQKQRAELERKLKQAA
jgi:hypothetical protein